ncbi:MAG TPA: HAD-IIIC family phosphatase [Verrucomicrobiae bacterium]|jgi:FkbH-like protein
MTSRLPFLLISDFNLSNLAALLSKDPGAPGLDAAAAPFGQVMQTLMNPRAAEWSADTAGAVVWSTPQSVCLGFRQLLEGLEADPESLLAQVDEFCQAVRSIPRQVKYIFVPAWTVDPFEGRLGVLDMDARQGISMALMRMNIRLAGQLRQDPRVVVLDASRWVAVHGQKSFSPRLWYMSKTPFSVDLFKEAALEIRAAMSALLGQAKKLIILDLDDTLWGGIVGDVGWQNVRIGGHDPAGEAFADFQAALKTLKRRGILLGIVSKNEESTALEAIRSNPEMILQLDDFAGWKINWKDKAQNIADLASELNLGLQSVVFIDDNPVERDRVRAALAEVLAPDWPANPMEYRAALRRLRCFDAAHVTEEDRQRSEMYVSERKRRESGAQVESVEQWLRALQMQVTVEPASLANIERIAQLLNKTNQMNLATRRMTREELWAWSQRTENMLFGFRVSDKFGDYGLAGLAGLHRESPASPESEVVDFILSCRVMGRKVEETMLHVLSRHAKGQGVGRMRLEYRPTSKNQPCLGFLETAGLAREGHVFSLDLTETYPQPGTAALIIPPDLEAAWQGELCHKGT